MNGPVRILISALGGEGGGVLASWIVDAALACGFIAAHFGARRRPAHRQHDLLH